jgi:hypothetical protein
MNKKITTKDIDTIVNYIVNDLQKRFKYNFTQDIINAYNHFKYRNFINYSKIYNNENKFVIWDTDKQKRKFSPLSYIIKKNKIRCEAIKECIVYPLENYELDKPIQIIIKFTYKGYSGDDMLIEKCFIEIICKELSVLMKIFFHKKDEYVIYELTLEEFKFLKSEILKKQRRCSLLCKLSNLKNFITNITQK